MVLGPGQSISHQIILAIKELTQDMDVTEEHLDIIKIKKCTSDLMHGLNSLEYVTCSMNSYRWRKSRLAKKFYRI